ncbi:MAG: hypothetical protein FD143_3633 [Ignavibacteria bacterium]|nr:MAG: hypothetical protein FD143_3633 [Ignavibacteria bacterium]
MRSCYLRNQDMNLVGLAEFESKLQKLKAGPNLFSHKEIIKAIKSPKGSKSKSGKGQSGKGLDNFSSIHSLVSKHKLTSHAFPPGKKPRLLHVFRI